jgi:hypothetical protein
MTACSTVKSGRFVSNSQFAYPNSNIKMLGPTRAEITNKSIILAPKFDISDLKQAYNKALAGQAGANILVNFSEDTTFHAVFGINTLTYELKGEAARMEVGQQYIR